MNLQDYFLAFVPIFVAVDAIGMVPIFMSLTRGIPRERKEKILRSSILTALGVAVAFLWIGRLVFSWLGVTISDFLVAGGVVLFIISIRDLLSFTRRSGVPDETLGAVPLAVPLIVGPAVLTTSLILLNAFGIYPTLFSIVTNILLCGVVLHYSDGLSRVLGEGGTQTLSKISNLLLAAIAVMLMRRGLQEIVATWIQK